MQHLKYLLIILMTFVLAACQQSNQPLVANAGEDFSVVMGSAPAFDGCASTGDIVNYNWTIVSAPDAMSDDAGKIIREVDANCSFTLDANMGLEEVGVWVVELEVRDSAGNTNTDTVTVEVTQ